MSVWTWVGVGLGGFVVVSLLVGLVFARVLSALTDMSAIEAHIWAQAPVVSSSLSARREPA